MVALFLQLVVIALANLLPDVVDPLLLFCLKPGYFIGLFLTLLVCRLIGGKDVRGLHVEAVLLVLCFLQLFFKLCPVLGLRHRALAFVDAVREPFGFFLIPLFLGANLALQLVKCLAFEHLEKFKEFRISCGDNLVGHVTGHFAEFLALVIRFPGWEIGGVGDVLEVALGDDGVDLLGPFRCLMLIPSLMP